MAKTRRQYPLSLLFLLFLVILSAAQGGGGYLRRRVMIGSSRPSCSYSVECRGCKFECMAEQVPVEGNDPINTEYHYKCVCHHHHP